MSDKGKIRASKERRARHILWVIDHNAPSTINAIQENMPAVWSAWTDELRAFERSMAGQ